MEKLETKKTIEKRKAQVIFAIIFLFSLIPTFMVQFSDKKEIFFISISILSIVALYMRIRRLNYKLQNLLQDV